MSLITTRPHPGVRLKLIWLLMTRNSTQCNSPGIGSGSGVYVVPRVEGIEEIAVLREMVPGGRLAIAHGQMDESELEPTMLTFSNGEADILALHYYLA